jgi:hypothetical protein
VSATVGLSGIFTSSSVLYDSDLFQPHAHRRVLRIPSQLIRLSGLHGRFHFFRRVRQFFSKVN